MHSLTRADREQGAGAWRTSADALSSFGHYNDFRGIRLCLASPLYLHLI